ncbi:MAG: hypothetical protein IPJ08_25080 [Burkholderiales bacterium]|nr:hypothetical protein [Burkholderiales bacterium]
MRRIKKLASTVAMAACLVAWSKVHAQLEKAVVQLDFEELFVVGTGPDIGIGGSKSWNCIGSCANKPNSAAAKLSDLASTGISGLVSSFAERRALLDFAKAVENGDPRLGLGLGVNFGAVGGFSQSSSIEHTLSTTLWR